jgi:hypothetical protein
MLRTFTISIIIWGHTKASYTAVHNLYNLKDVWRIVLKGGRGGERGGELCLVHVADGGQRQLGTHPRRESVTWRRYLVA